MVQKSSQKAEISNTSLAQVLSEAAQITAAEQVFFKRMLPHFMAGKTVEESARAVLDDDQRIMNEVFANNRSGVEDGVREAFTAEIYHRCRSAA